MSAAAPVKPRGRSGQPSTARRPAAGAKRTRPSAAATPVANGGGTPPRTLEAAHAPHPDLHSFRAQQFPFDLQVPAIPSEQTSSGDHAVAGDARFSAVSHDVAHGARRARFSRQGRDVTVGGDTAGGDPSDNRQYVAAKFCHWPTMMRTLSVKPPRLCSSYRLATLLAESPNAFGTNDHRPSTAAAIQLRIGVSTPART
jgi:hypothetical protein